MKMVGVSTGQNITNIIPAIQLKASQLILLETKTAKRDNWSNGIAEVAEFRNIRIDLVELYSDNDIGIILTQLEERFALSDTPLYWNIGGGQKPQQIAIWECFKRRCQRGHEDRVCYTNQDQGGKIEIWRIGANDSPELDGSPQPVNLSIGAREVFMVFGVGIEDPGQLLFDKNAQPPSAAGWPTFDLMGHQAFRRYLFEMATIRNSPGPSFSLDDIKICVREHASEFDALISTLAGKPSSELRGALLGSAKRRGLLAEKLQQEKSPPQVPLDESLRNSLTPLYENLSNMVPADILARCLPVGVRQSTADYFEYIVAQRVAQGLFSGKFHNIVEAHANLKTRKDGQINAEYDILCVTNKGNIIALDAKTFDFEQKDIDARLYNLERGSGYYRKFIAVLPFDEEDLNESWFPKALRDLPFKLSRKRLPFYVISDSKRRMFWIKADGGQIQVDHQDPRNPEWVKCTPLPDVLA